MKSFRNIPVILLLSLFVCQISAQDTDKAPFRVQRLSDRAAVFTEESPMENMIVVLASAKGLVVVDSTGSPYTASLLRKAIADEFGRSDFAYLINTHHHWDHALGNQAFDDAVVVAYEGCVEAMRRDAANVAGIAATMGRRADELKTQLDGLDPDSGEAADLRLAYEFNSRNNKGLSEGFKTTLPEKTFADNLVLDLGDLTVKLFYFGRAHSGNDIFIQVPEEGLLLTGDLFLERGWLPLFSGQQKLDIPRWIEVLNRTLDGEDEVKYVIPGHRDIWTREKLAMWRDYIVDLWSGVNSAAAEGLDLEAVLERYPLPEKFFYLKELNHDDAELLRFQERNVTAFWRQLKESAAEIVEAAIRDDGLEAGLKKYRELKTGGSKDVYFSENDFNALGYRLLQSGNVEAAIEVFKLNVEAYPESWNVYDSLGEAYMVNGDKKPAIKYYKKSLELNPDNSNAVEILKNLQETK